MKVRAKGLAIAAAAALALSAGALAGEKATSSDKASAAAAVGSAGSSEAAAADPDAPRVTGFIRPVVKLYTEDGQPAGQRPASALTGELPIVGENATLGLLAVSHGEETLWVRRAHARTAGLLTAIPSPCLQEMQLAQNDRMLGGERMAMGLQKCEKADDTKPSASN